MGTADYMLIDVTELCGLTAGQISRCEAEGSWEVSARFWWRRARCAKHMERACNAGEIVGDSPPCFSISAVLFKLFLKTRVLTVMLKLFSNVKVV